MTKATNLSICVLMAASLIVLILEVMSNRQRKAGLTEKPHIRLFTIASLSVPLILLFLDLNQNPQAILLPLVYLDHIAALFLVINTFFAILLGRDHQLKNISTEMYFLLLASLALAISNVSTSSIIIKMMTSIGWLTGMTALAIRSIPGGKKTEVGLKMGFLIIVVVIQFLVAILLLSQSHMSFDLNSLVINNTVAISTPYLGLILLALIGVALTGSPPYHFGHVDCADGASNDIAFLFLSNAAILGSVLLNSIKSILIRSGLHIDNEVNLLGAMLIFGFMILCLRSLDQSKLRRTAAYIATSVGPLFSMTMLFGESVLLPKFIFVLAMFIFLGLSVFTLYGSMAYLEPMNQPLQTWEDMSGFGRIKPLPTLTFLVAIAAIAGLPGTMGYFVKLSLIAPTHESIVFSGAIFLSIAFGVACVMRVFVFMFSKQQHGRFLNVVNARPSPILIIASIILIGFGFFPFVR